MASIETDRMIEQFVNISKTLFSSVPQSFWHAMQATVVVVRGSGSTFAKDFFCPLYHLVSSIEGLAFKHLLQASALAVDVATLLIRTVTLPFKATYVFIKEYETSIDRNKTGRVQHILERVPLLTSAQIRKLIEEDREAYRAAHPCQALVSSISQEEERQHTLALEFGKRYQAVIGAVDFAASQQLLSLHQEFVAKGLQLPMELPPSEYTKSILSPIRTLLNTLQNLDTINKASAFKHPHNASETCFGAPRLKEAAVGVNKTANNPYWASYLKPTTGPCVASDMLVQCFENTGRKKVYLGGGMIVRKSGKHGFPGGFNDDRYMENKAGRHIHDESAREAAVREAHEETQTSVSDLHLVGYYSGENRDYRGNHSSAAYVGTTEDPLAHADDAADAYILKPETYFALIKYETSVWDDYERMVQSPDPILNNPENILAAKAKTLLAFDHGRMLRDAKEALNKVLEGADITINDARFG